MPVPREAVLYAYRYLLNREPESEAAIQATEQAGDWRQIRRTFLASNEFRNRELTAFLGGSERIGRHLDVDHLPVDISTAPGQLGAMLDRIASNWRAFGETEPHWSVITNELFKRDTLDSHLDGFLAHGRSDVEMLLRYVSRAGLPLTFGRAMDFGCGVGRMTIALADHATSVAGVDISPGHLREAKRLCEGSDVGNVEFVQIDRIEDIDALGTFDLIISRIVLQHNPPPIMAAIYRRLLRRLGTGGVAVIQMPTFIRNQSFDAQSYLTGAVEPMEMNALPQREIFRIIAEEGCIPLEVREDDHLGSVDGLSHTFAVMRPEPV